MKRTCSQCRVEFEGPGDAPTSGSDLCPACSQSRVIRQAATVTYSTTDVPKLSPPGAGPQPQSLRDDEILQAGTILGQYRIEGFIGRGGMGAVYKARHSMLDRIVALKVLPAKFSADPEFINRFRREALALANLSHPNIVAIHDMGQQGEIHFFVMEFVDGVNLRDLLQHKKLAPEQALRIVPQLCDALEYAHSKGIIHRDIKPANILLDAAGSAKVADFGLAKIMNADPAATRLTQTNVVMGTVEYMAPEQRENLKSVDHRADIYSMGVVLYELLTGELPVGKFDLPSRRVQVHVRIDDVVLKALERDPEQRYQRASQMGTDVGQVIGGTVPPRDVPVVDLKGGKAIGTAPGRRLAVRTNGSEVSVRGWSRDEIGVETEDAFEFNGAPAVPIVQADRTLLTIYVPKGAELDVASRGGTVTAASVAGQLVADVRDGEFSGSLHEGSLSVRSDSGDVTVAGLRTESLEIVVQDSGSVSVTGLELERGRASITTREGDIEVSSRPVSSFRYDLQSASGTVSSPGGGSQGQVGAGAANLHARSANGNVRLDLGQAPIVNLAGLKHALLNLPPKQIERLGVFAIVNAGILLFSILVLKTLLPFVCVAVFWGMSIALDLWRGFVRGTTRVEGAVPPAAPPPPPAAPPPPRPRASVLAALGLLAGIAAIVTSGAGAILVEFEGNAGPARSVGKLGDIRLGQFGCAAVGSALALLALGFVLAGGRHLRESKGRLTGRAALAIAFLFSLGALAVATWKISPHLETLQREGTEAGHAAQAFLEMLRAGEYEGAHGSMAAALRNSVTVGEMTERIGKQIDPKSESWKHLRYDRAEVAAGLDRGRAIFRFVSKDARTAGTGVGMMREEGEWRVSDPRELLLRLGVETDGSFKSNR